MKRQLMTKDKKFCKKVFDLLYLKEQKKYCLSRVYCLIDISTFISENMT